MRSHEGGEQDRSGIGKIGEAERGQLLTLDMSCQVEKAWGQPLIVEISCQVSRVDPQAYKRRIGARPSREVAHDSLQVSTLRERA